MKVYLVGGAVRDELLGRSVQDRDWVVVGATSEALLDRGYTQIGNEFPCFLHPDTKDEYALARKERKSGSGHTGFVCEFGPEVTLEDDLSRRDLTINAMARSEGGELIDPYGGRTDMENRVLRHVSEAFVEDPLRVLRVARFAARYAELGFTVHPDTLALMRQLAESGELDTLTAERVWKEMSRAIDEPRPSEFFQVLRACGALKVLLPELDRLFGVPQPEDHHPEVDTGVHVMMVIDVARRLFDRTEVTWAALLHDLGKGITPESEWPKHLRHESLGVPLVEDVCNRLRVPKEYKALAKLVCEHHLRCHRVLEMRAGSVLRLLEAVDVFRRPERLELFVQACEADARGRLGLEDCDYPQAQRLLELGEVARGVETAPLLAAGYQGLELAEQLRHRRIKAMAGHVSGSG